MLRRLLLATAVAGIAATTAAPASAVQLYCRSVDASCARWSCPAGYTEYVDEGLSSGPWVVVCGPYVP